MDALVIDVFSKIEFWSRFQIYHSDGNGNLLMMKIYFSLLFESSLKITCFITCFSFYFSLVPSGCQYGRPTPSS